MLLVHGEIDWSHAREREANKALIPGAKLETVSGAGQMLSLERPNATIAAIRRLAPRTP